MTTLTVSQDKKTLGNAFNQIAYGEVMKAAARDYLAVSSEGC